MIKIITPGEDQKERPVRRFECAYCGCVFNSDEYEVEYAHCRITRYCKCPCCEGYTFII